MEKSNALTPKLRFPEFRGDWQEDEFGNMGEFIGGGTPSKSIPEYWEGEIPWISSSDIDEDNIHDIRISRHITKEGLADSATKVVPANSIIIISRVGVGKVAVNQFPLCTSQDYTNLVPTSNEAVFMAYLLLAKKNILLSLKQGTSIQGFTQRELSKLVLKIPEPDEQKRIATFLSAVDRHIKLLDEKKKGLERYENALMQKLFPKADEMLPELRFKDENGKDFEDWVEKSYGQILDIGSGRDYKHLQAGDIPVYGTGGLMTKVNDFLHDGPSPCIGRKGTIDNPVFLEGKFWTVDTLFYTHNFRGVNPYFVFLLFKRTNWVKYNEASGVPSLSKSTIEKLKIWIPNSLIEQEMIVSAIEKIERLQSHLEEQVKKADRFKKGLIQKMFV